MNSQINPNDLLPYTAEQSDTFLGREKEINLLVSSLGSSRLTVVYGGNKVGITSLLQAGIFAQLRNNAEWHKSAGSDLRSQPKRERPTYLPIYIDYQKIYSNLIGVYSNGYNTLRGSMFDILNQGLQQVGHGFSLPPEDKMTQDLYIEFLKACVREIGANNDNGVIYIIVDNADLAFLSSHDTTCFFRDIIIPVIQIPEITINFMLAFRTDSVILLDRFKDEHDLLANRYEIFPFEETIAKELIAKNQQNQHNGLDKDVKVLQNNGFIEDPADKNISCIKDYQSITFSSNSLMTDPRAIRPTYLKIALKLNDNQDGTSMRSLISRYVTDNLSTYEDDEQIIAALIISYIASAGSSTQTSLEYLFKTMLRDQHSLVYLPIREPFSCFFQSDSRLNDILNKLSNGHLIGKHGLSFEIHPDFQHELIIWKDRILSSMAQFNASRASSIASQSIIISMQLAQSMEIELARTELSGLLALQAYSYSKYANVDYKSAIFDKAFRKFLQYPYSTKELSIISKDKLEVSAVALSYNSKRIATVDSSGQIKIYEEYFIGRNWKSDNLKPYIVDSEQGTATSIVFHPECEHILVIGYKNGAVECCLLNKDMTAHQLYQCKAATNISSCERPEFGVGPGPIAFNSDGTWLAFGGWDKKITLWKLSKLLPDHYDEFKPTFNGDYRLANWEFCDDWVWSIAFSHTTNKMAVGCRNGNLLIYDIEKFSQDKDLSFPTYDVIQLSDILTTSPFSEKRVLDYDLPRHRPYEIFAVSYSPNDEWIAIGSWGLVCIFDPLLADKQEINQKLNRIAQENKDNPTANFKPIFKQTIVRYSSERERGIRSLAFSSDSKYLCIGSDDFISDTSDAKNKNELMDQTLRLWDITKRDTPAIVLRAPTPHPLGINRVVFSEKNIFVVTSSWDGTVRLWYLKPERTEPLLLADHIGSVRAVSWSPNGKLLACAAGDKNNTVWLWNCEWLWPDPEKGVESRKPISLPQSYCGINTLAFSLDNKLLASGSCQGDNCGRIWDIEDPGQNPRTLNWHSGEVRSVSFSKNYFASGGWDRTLNLWNYNNLNDPPRIINSFPGSIRCLALSNNERWLAVGIESLINSNEGCGQLFLLEIQKLREKCKIGESIVFSTEVAIPLEASLDQTFSIAISPDSRLLASVSTNNQLQVFNLENNTESVIIFDPLKEKLKGLFFSGSSIAFSAKGTMLAIGCWSANEDDPNQKHGVVCLWQVSRLKEKEANKLPTVLRLPHSEIIDKPGQAQNHVTSVAFSPAPFRSCSSNSDLHDSDSQFLAFGSIDGTIRVWTVGTGMLAKLTASQVTRNMTKQEWNEYIDEGYRLSPYEYTLPSKWISTQTEPIPHDARQSWLSENLNALGCPPFFS